jgi:hypothetical protein
MSSLFISPSLTAYERNNPAFKIFYADAHFDSGDKVQSSFDILDYELYVFDLEEANKRPDEEPNWFPLYRATTSYGIPNTKLDNLASFIDRMAGNKTLFDLYYQ